MKYPLTWLGLEGEDTEPHYDLPKKRFRIFCTPNPVPAKNSKIPTIKEVRRVMGTGLNETKEFVEGTREFDINLEDADWETRRVLTTLLANMFHNIENHRNCQITICDVTVSTHVSWGRRVSFTNGSF
jgi:hypothetical protein